MINGILKIGYYVVVAVFLSVAVLLAASLLPIPGNYQIKVVLSGSMEPAIHTGSVVVIKPSDNYKIDDIITFGKDTKRDVPTTHRIVEMSVVSGEMLYKTKGDANNGVDSQEVKESAVIGKVLFSIPYAGYMIDFARQPIGFILLVIIPVMCIMVDEIKKIWIEVKKIKEKKAAEIKSKRDPFLVDKEDKGRDPNPDERDG